MTPWARLFSTVWFYLTLQCETHWLPPYPLLISNVAPYARFVACRAVGGSRRGRSFGRQQRVAAVVVMRHAFGIFPSAGCHQALRDLVSEIKTSRLFLIVLDVGQNQFVLSSF